MKEYSMPSPLTFSQEGGVSLNTDGTKFYTVRTITFHNPFEPTNSFFPRGNREDPIYG